MSEIKKQIQEAMEKDSELKNASEPLINQSLDKEFVPEVQAFAEIYPSLVDTNYETVELEVEPEKKEKEERERRKSMSASERNKRIIQREREENLRLKNELYQKELERINAEKKNREIAFNFIETKTEFYKKSLEEAALMEDHYNSTGDTESARAKRYEQNEYLNNMKQLEIARNQLEQEYKIINNEFEARKNSRPLNYLPIDVEPADEEQKENYQEFIKNNPFLNPNDQENYLRDAEMVANAVHDEVVKWYKVRGQGSQVGTKAFFDDIARITKERITGSLEPRNSNLNHNSIGAPSTRKLAIDNKVTLNQKEASLRNAFAKKFGQDYMKQYDNILKQTKTRGI